MLTVQEALEQIIAKTQTLPAETVPLSAVCGRVLAEDIRADIDNPPFDNSSVDGYAVRARDTFGARPDLAVPLRLIGEVSAGGKEGPTLSSGTCVRIMTGAPIPSGADAVVMQEDVELRPGSKSVIWVQAAAKSGGNMREAGSDIRRGEGVICAGSKLGPPEMALLAAMGCAEVLVYRRPRAAVYSTGDELVPVHMTPGAGQIRDSNRVMLVALLEEAGAEIIHDCLLKDDFEATKEAFSIAAGLRNQPACDIIVASGGVSVGERDFVRPALEELGSLDLWRVNMKPGKPLAFGSIGATLFFGTPGNPVSTMVAFELFVRPAVAKLRGDLKSQRPIIEATLSESFDRKPGRPEYIRATLKWNNGGFEATVTGSQGSGALRSMVGANALLLIDEESEHLVAGMPIKAILMNVPTVSSPPRDLSA